MDHQEPEEDSRGSNHGDKINEYYGVIVENSLQSPQALNRTFQVASVRPITWRFVLLQVPEHQLTQEISSLQLAMIERRSDCWYNHFFRDEELIIVFQDKTFKASIDPKSWHEAVAYGLENGIPRAQLDFTPRTTEEVRQFFGLTDL